MKLFIDDDGDAYLEPEGSPLNLVALPALDENGAILNPEAWAEMIRRFNDPELEALRTENARLRLGLRIIAGQEQCLDNLMSHADIARAALLEEGK